MGKFLTVIKNFNLPELRKTLLEISLRDASLNSELYQQTEIKEDITQIHALLEFVDTLKEKSFRN
ncbi:MAG: hypothetical protein MK066_11515 [Crocinitomicaceae bacterium]|nr:hypothetical protein [Crocinitomicaceae bacterium]